MPTAKESNSISKMPPKINKALCLHLTQSKLPQKPIRMGTPKEDIKKM